VIEPDVIELPNLNRYPLARRSDCGRRKADVLNGFGTPAVRIASVADRFSAATSTTIGPLASHVLVGVDDIPARWDVQRAAPGWVCVAGTSHLFALVTAHERGEACAGCVHPRDEDIGGTIPTISFVSFWAGLMQMRELLRRAAGAAAAHPVLNIWPFGLFGPHALHATDLAPNAACPVGCQASRRVG
jgi:hypothetical protein